MADDQGEFTRDPLIRAFGAILRAHRNENGLSRAQLAEALGCTPQWIEKMETGTKPSVASAVDLDTYFGLSAKTFQTMAEEIEHAGRQNAVPPGFSGFVKREAEASVIYVFENMVVTGLFQTRDYAYEVLRTGRKPETTDQLVATRMERQEILTRDDPPQVVAVFDEAVIRRLIGTREVLKGQVEHLIRLAAEPNITVQLVPGGKGTYAGLMGAFVILGFTAYADIVYVDGHAGGQLIDEAAKVREHTHRFNLIRGAAMSEDETLSLLRTELEDR
jgi:transcriptional regulator with XRE-family HTH domain